MRSFLFKKEEPRLDTSLAEVVRSDGRDARKPRKGHSRASETYAECSLSFLKKTTIFGLPFRYREIAISAAVFLF